MDYNSDSDIEDVIQERLELKIESTNINSVYDMYLKDKTQLQLQPVYQREFCWSMPKMNLFIDSIMNNFIIPNFVIYELTSKERSITNHFFECVDGQHRFVTLKKYIEGESIPFSNTNVYLHFRRGDDKIYYNLNEHILKDLNRKNRRFVHRNMNIEERNHFNRFQLSLHFIKSRGGLSITTKCIIFNRLQNGARVQTYVKLKNEPHPITDFIRDNSILQSFKTKKIYELFSTKKQEDPFLLYFFIRLILIFDRKDLNINFLDLNITKYIQDKLPCANVSNPVQETFLKIEKFLTYIQNKFNKDKEIFLEEFIFLLGCIYINCGEDELNILLTKFNRETLQKWNQAEKYHDKDKVTSSERMKEIYSVFMKQIK